MKKYLYLNDRIYIKIGRDKLEPEKSILPAIIFINTNHSEFGEFKHKCFVICLGWWDYSFKFGLFL